MADVAYTASVVKPVAERTTYLQVVEAEQVFRATVPLSATAVYKVTPYSPYSVGVASDLVLVPANEYAL